MLFFLRGATCRSVPGTAVFTKSKRNRKDGDRSRARESRSVLLLDCAHILVEIWRPEACYVLHTKRPG